MNGEVLGMEIVGWIAWGTGIVGVSVLAWGVLTGIVELGRLEVHRIRGSETAHERAYVRQDLGYYILLGLEFLIAADIMHTIARPTLEELAILGGTVLIRTVISHYLTAEMRDSGRLERWGGSATDAGDAVGDATD